MVRINRQWSVVGDIELLQGGIYGLTAAFYGIAFQGGVRFAW
jgi:hypothetical protein